MKLDLTVSEKHTVMIGALNTQISEYKQLLATKTEEVVQVQTKLKTEFDAAINELHVQNVNLHSELDEKVKEFNDIIIVHDQHS